MEYRIGAATAISTNPIWVLNTRLAVRKDAMDETEGAPKKKKSTFDAAREIYSEEGIRGFFKGVVPALILVINPIIQYTVFEQLKAFIEKSRKLTNFDFFWLGAVSKLAATGITYPYMYAWTGASCLSFLFLILSHILVSSSNGCS